MLNINKSVIAAFAGGIGLLGPLNTHAFADLMDGLVGYWSFDQETAEDKSCNTHDGVIYGAEPCDGVAGMAMCFNDADQNYINIPDVGDFAWNNQSVTFSLWTQVKDNPDLYRDYISLGSESQGEPTIEIAKYRAGQWEGRIFMIVHLGGSNYSAACSDTTGPELELTPDRWIHLAGVYDSTDGKVWLYVNGELQSDHRGLESISYDLSNVGDLNLNLGQHCETSGPNTWHNGPLDEIRIYDRALTEDEIKSLYHMHKNCPADVNGDGKVDIDDVFLVLGNWGDCE